MQFHVDGFKPGDPAVLDLAMGSGDGPGPGHVDVLIVGCGPAGLTLASQLAAFPSIKTMIVEEKTGPLLVGQADGIACRTMEMFEAFGFSGRVLKESYWVNETSFWGPGVDRRQDIVRNGRVRDTEEGLSEFPHVILNQARVHDFFLDVMRNSPTRLEPNYARRMSGLKIADSRVGTDANEADGEGAYPVTVSLERLDAGHEGEVETVRARFVVGCDGARSAVRKSMNRVLDGDSANQAWGVMDVLAVTDFPDIRLKATIHSASEGSALIIPREGGFLVRLYIELDKLNDNERVSNRNITAEHLIAAAQRILQPYTLEVKEVAWWSVYEIGQRLCDKFDDVPQEEVATRIPRVFIAGDACHTHSPKAGQGMNVSMQDGFNLGWKLASVATGRCSPQILHSYSDERQGIAKELIDFDREFAKMFSLPPIDPSDSDSQGVDPAEFQEYFVKQGRFTAGTATRYRSSIITAEPVYQDLAKGLLIGTRFHSAPVIRLADAKPVHLGHAGKADGRWRLFAFAATDAMLPTSSIQTLCRFLEESPDSPVRKFTPKDGDIDSVLDVRAIFQQAHCELAIESMPSLLLPRKGRYGLYDYEKMFCADIAGADDIFSLRAIDRVKGCMIIVRPDQHIANILPLEAHAELASFFDMFMI